MFGAAAFAGALPTLVAMSRKKPRKYYYGVDMAGTAGDATCAVRYWVDDHGHVHVEEVTFRDMYEPPVLETRQVPGSNPPCYEVIPGVL